jgi:hypothetical protein
MSKVKNVDISWVASDSPDVVGYRFYYQDVDMFLDYDAPYVDLGNVTTINVAAVLELSGLDGIYNIGITAIDDAGNESAMSIAENIPLDLESPNAPGLITVVRS